MQAVASEGEPSAESFIVRRFSSELLEPALNIPDWSNQDIESFSQHQKDDVAESYTRLQEALTQARSKLGRPKDDTRRELDDVLKLLEKESSRRSKNERRSADALRALRSCNITLNIFALDDFPSRRLLWGAIWHLIDNTRNRLEIYANFLDHLITIGKLFEQVIDMISPRPIPSIRKHTIGLQQCFIDSITIHVKFFLQTTKLKWATLQTLKFEGLSAQLREKNEEMNDHIGSIRREQLKMQQRDIQEIHEVVRGIRQDTVTVREEIRNELLEFSQEHRRDLTDYAQYIDAPLIEILDLHQGYLIEDASHVAINLLDEPKVCRWIESEASSLLCIEGFSTGEFLNWTTEFALDVVHAAQDRGYAVLHHFCDLLDPIRPKLDEDEEGDLATTTILKCFLCLIHSQCKPHFVDKSYDQVRDFGADMIARASEQEIDACLRYCLKSFKPGIVLFIVIDSVHLLEAWTNGETQNWLRSITTLAQFENIVVKILFTSIVSPSSSVSLFEQWKEEKTPNQGDATASDRDEQARRPAGLSYQVWSRLDDTRSGSNQVSARRKGTPSKPI